MAGAELEQRRTEQHDAAAVVAGLRARLFRVAVGVCGDLDLAEEAVADAIARSWPRLQTGGIEDPAAYLRRAVLNSLHGRFRRLALERRARARRDGDGRGGADEIGTVSDRDEIVTALARLPERQRVMVVLRFYEDLSESQIASTMGIPAGTVKSNMSRAMARMRVLLEGSGDE